MGFRSHVRRSTLVDANECRDWRIYADWAQSLIRRARRLNATEAIALELDQTVYTFDATVIDLCLSLFPWTHFRSTKAAIKLHTILDLRGSIPTFLALTEGSVHEINLLDEVPIDPGSIYVMDRGYLDFTRLACFTKAGAFFVVRAKSNLHSYVSASRPVDCRTGLRCDQSIKLRGFYSRQGYPDSLRRIRYRDPEHERSLVFLTNHFSLSALKITEPIQGSLADRDLLSLDQTAPAHPLVYGYFRQRRPHSDLVRDQHLSLGRDSQADSEIEAKSAGNSSSIQCHPV
jgi:hypothetical protein